MAMWSMVRDPVGVLRGVPMVRVAVVIPARKSIIQTEHTVHAVPVRVMKDIPVHRPAMITI